MRIALVFPELLGTYGDGGNARVLARRLEWREIAHEVREVSMDDVLPGADVYLLGGGEDGPQRLAVELLREGGLVERVRDGAKVFAVCAGLQILGERFAVEGDDEFPGLGLIDAVTRRGPERRVGDIVIRTGAGDEGLVVGFENHGGVTTLAPGIASLGTVARGYGNDGRVDGVRTREVWGTYAHGPVLAMNPGLADALLEDVLGRPLEPLPGVADELHLARVRATRPTA